MDINVYLFIVIALMLLIIMYLLFVLRRVRTQLALIKDALEDIKGGNLNRRILAGENDMTTFFVLPAVIALLGSYMICREEQEDTLIAVRLKPMLQIDF